MWIRCKCNYKIHDSSDLLFYKGYIISDQDWFDFLDLVSEAIKSDEKDREKLEKAYYSLFEYLKGKNILRWASLSVNGKRVHYWSNKE